MTRYSREQIKEWTGVDIEEDYGYIEVLSERQYKSRRQSNAFHALLGCYWKSGCSSFSTYDAMRNHYKEIAHLLEMQTYCPLEPFTKECLHRAVKLLPIEKSEREKIYELLRGRIAVWHSFSECSKEMATIAISQMISDMWNSRVDDSPMAGKFREILDGMREWYEQY